jgi:NAD(P)-dependent dehydrogenase (short-subunit alcohol dehydrogenase family)
VKALITGGEGGLGRAIRSRLEAEGYEVQSLDLVNGFDVTSPDDWDEVGPVDLACLNAGVLGTDYRRAVAVNVDGVVFGVQRLASVMREGAIVATASLAGLTAMPSDPIYSLTKHAVVGYVRSIAPHLEPIRINAVCPGIADTPMIDPVREQLAGFPLVQPAEVAEAVWLAATSGRSGECWFVQPGRDPAPFRFPNLPGPRVDGEPVGPPPS